MERISIPARLENERALLVSLEDADFEALYAVAADPELWAQHPNKDRWQKEVFKIFFQGAMESKGAFKIIDKLSQSVVGSTRFYDYKAADNSIFIGYTFYARSCWGKGINQVVKQMMLDYVFRFVSKVNFHIGADNKRSQVAIGRLGARKVAEEEVAYFGEPNRLNFVYEIRKEDWEQKREHE